MDGERNRGVETNCFSSFYVRNLFFFKLKLKASIYRPFSCYKDADCCLDGTGQDFMNKMS